MFFWYCVIATLGYALQSTLMVSVYRRVDRLTAITYRGLSLGISMLPLLFFTPLSSYARTPEYLCPILIAALLAAAGNWSVANAYAFLPVAIASSISMSAAAIVVATLGFVSLGEALAGTQLLFFCLVLLGILLLGFSKTSGERPVEFDLVKGIVCCLLFGLFLGGAFFVMGGTARRLDPFLTGYLWEVIIGIVAGVIALLRRARGGVGLVSVPKSDLIKILVFSSPTAIGTGCYSYALTIGPMAIATAIISTMMIFSTILAFFLFKERPSLVQCLALLFLCFAVIGLKMTAS